MLAASILISGPLFISPSGFNHPLFPIPIGLAADTLERCLNLKNTSNSIKIACQAHSPECL
jgi:hypothetical protein